MNSKEDGAALITGASSGIGAAYARALAAQGKNLILVARRKERLAILAEELHRNHAVVAEVLVADLTKSADIERVEKRIREIEFLDMLINNAGFGTFGNFSEIDIAGQMDMIHVHIVASVRLCWAALPGMIARGNGVIINVSSMGAFIPMQGNVTYGATKAFLITFSEALQRELMGTGVRIQALCPGFTRTEFHDTSEYEKLDRSLIPRFMWTSADDIVAASLRSLKTGKVTYIPGLRNRLLVAVNRNRTISKLLLSKLRRKSQRGQQPG
ncbi:MAG: SDR family oxidoreductase [Candidatus Abyssobacteria bacterium SURF_17]|uniref:SDR family oxidoreductase n=1 Tax=Candidatus Abyssobacteria bacterium SURF_17 TaxID=2093361 RepID=A0A419ERV7_9BACT|nr:MAG: SDR family oxidoreductase [Candidatus Abyssubacteria bacterium SURF_17]